MTKIFINYRTEDEPFGAVFLDHELSRRFGSGVVFRASKSIPPGADFSERILAAVRGAQTLLVVIGPRWLDARGADGLPRLRKPGDWVRREIAEAFEHGIRVVPILLNADLPAAADLPEDVRRLASCQYLRLHHRNSQRDVEQLVDELTELAPDLAPVISADRVGHRRAVKVGIPVALLAAGLVTWLIISLAPSGSTRAETVNSVAGARTFRDPHILQTGEGLRVDNKTTVQVSCKITSNALSSGQYWYRIASAPWDNQYYSPAISYLNGDPPTGPYSRVVDLAIPDCPS